MCFGSAALLAASASAATVTWTGATDGAWDTTTANWSGGSPTANLYNNTTPDAVVFDDSTSATNTTISLAAGLTPASVTVNNSTRNYTFQTNGFGGGGGLTKQGTGTLTLAVANAYSGGTTISVGTLQLNNAGSAGSGLITLNDASTGVNNTTLNLNAGGGANYANAITVANQGSGVSTIAFTTASSASSFTTGTITLNRAATFTASTLGGYLVWNSPLAGAGPLTIGSTNNQRLIMGAAGTSAYTGDVTVSAGAVFEPRAYLVGNNFTVDGTLQVVFNDAVINSLNGGGIVQSNTYGGARTLTVGQGGGGGTFSGTIQDNGNTLALTKTGSGTQILSGANTHTGATTVNAGTLNLSNQLAVQNSVLTLNGGAVVFDQSVAGNAFTTAGLAGSGTLALQNNATTPAAIALTVGNNNASASYSGIFSGAGSLTKVGTGTQTLGGGANTFSGAVTVSAGTLQLNTTTALGTGAITLNDAGTGANNTTLKINAGTYANAITVANQGSGVSTISTASTSGTFNFSGGLTLNKGATFGAASGLSSWMVFDNGFSLAGAGTLTLDNTKSAGGNGLILNDINAVNFTGDVVVNANAVLEARNQLNPNGTTKVAGNNMRVDGWLYLSGGANNTTLNALTGTGTIGTRWNGQSTLTVGQGDGGGTFSGVIQDGTPAGSASTALIKTGTGTQILSGTNTYTGTTAVNSGVLLVNGTHNTASGGAYTVSKGLNTSATLGGGASLAAPGTINSSGQVSIAIDGQITGGDLGTIGALRITGSGGINLAGTYLFDVNYTGAEQGDLLSISGAAQSAVVLGGKFELNELSTTPVAGSHYAIKIFESANGVAGVGPGQSDYTNTSGLASYQSIVTWDGGKTYYLVPEPASFALLGLGSLLLLRRPSRRSSRRRLAVV